ncbi:hypothetical protein J5N97_004453 [Dioscorea zingiberensis]|uniref:CRM domain-containing protein n=1 Tax=Dioscorea zingiberensis TaxID=325984 RepID=A0A9D5D821_9LILI|nr:hypothetical protein J5N97_004453 [Dioscorea zingiberensis]
MALKAIAPFPLFSPFPSPSRRPATELRFSRWNNANAEPFIRRQREQQEIEADLRLHRRHQSAALIASSDEPDPDHAPSPPFKSLGTPSSPSSPSIPGKASKYSKPPQNPNKARSHPAFRRVYRARVPPVSDEQAGIVVGDRGIAYRIKDAPFEFQYSYTETPKVKPLALREAPFLPFGPSTMPRPWTGRAPTPESRKNRPEFDSFRLPPPGKKGVKPVQSPGPFIAGSGPKYKAMSREEILGEPLTGEELKDLIKSGMKTTRQLNMGRDGLTHNMLDNIHAHWKRRRICKIKCKGVCTVDMDNVRQQLEEKTGGKIIYNRGGVIFLFRGRNYNYKTRPRYPIMLWRPITPVYPRLVQRAPEGLTLEEANEMRKRGRKLVPICKLAKNGVYSNLVKHVKEAFEECELVRINCTGLNKSDYKKIGAKLKDLVPCVLISFEYEHILLWRGKDWKSSMPPLEVKNNEAEEPISNDSTATSPRTTDLLWDHQSSLVLSERNSADEKHDLEIHTDSIIPGEDVSLESNVAFNLETISESKDGALPDSTKSSKDASDSVAIIHQETSDSDGEKGVGVDLHLKVHCQDIPLIQGSVLEESDSSSFTLRQDAESNSIDATHQGILPIQGPALEESNNLSVKEEGQQLAGSEEVSPLNSTNEAVIRVDGISVSSSPAVEVVRAESLEHQNTVKTGGKYLDGLILMLKQALENGSAVLLDDDSLDADLIYERSVTLAKTAPPGPTFHYRTRKTAVKRTNKQYTTIQNEDDIELETTVSNSENYDRKKNSRSRRDDLAVDFSDVVQYGSLRIDELAKLLA